MENKTKIEVVSVDDLKKIVKDTVGSNLNCAVVRDEKLPSGEFKVSKVPNNEFLKIASEYLFDGKVAVVTAEDMNKDQNSTNKKKSVKKKI